MSDALARTCAATALGDPGLHRIRFSICSFHIAPQQFFEIRRLIENNTIQVEHDPELRTPNLRVHSPLGVAVYHYGEDRLKLNFCRFASDPLMGRGQRALIIHEAVHAICDLYHARHMYTNTSEAAAYIAQCAYLQQHAGAFRSRAPLRDASAEHLMQIAWRLGGQVLAGTPLTHQNVREIRSAVNQVYTSADRRAGYDGIRTRGLFGRRGERVQPAAH